MKGEERIILVPRSMESAAEVLSAPLPGVFPGQTVSGYLGCEQVRKAVLADKADVVVIDLAACAAAELRGVLSAASKSSPKVPLVFLRSAGEEPEGQLLQAEAVFQVLEADCGGWELASVVRNALRWREARRLLKEKEQELNLLDEVGRAIISTLELKTVLNIILEKTREIVKSEAWSLLLVDEEARELYSSVAVGDGAEELRKFRLALGEGIAGWVAQQGKPVVVQNVKEDPRFFNESDHVSGLQVRSVLCVPLETRGRVLGVIEVVNKKGDGAFSDRDFNLVTKLAGFAAIAIENARLYQQAKMLTLTDELTQLYNARFFNQFLESEVKRCRRYESSVSLIFLDLDFFKGVNDQYGHLLGSKLLQEAAKLLRRGLRDVDIVARYGGDEFLIILPETRIVEAARVAERIRQSFEEHLFLVEDGLDVKVTASFGVGAFPEFSSSKEELVRFADQAMYRVKNKDRNGVFVADDPSLFDTEGEPRL